MTTAATETIDSFHRGQFQVIQPLGQGHRSGMDAMLLASLVASQKPCRVADLGAGAGAAGMAVASRLETAQIVLVERSPLMAQFARRSLALAQNARLNARISVLEADISLTGRARVAAGLADNSFDHVIMNPPFNDAADRKTPDALKAEAHAMTEGLFDTWIRTAAAIAKSGGQLSLIARPESIGEILTACARRFGGVEVTPLHPRTGENAVRILVTAIKQSRARLTMRAPLIIHEEETHKFAGFVDDLNNGRVAYHRRR